MTYEIDGTGLMILGMVCATVGFLVGLAMSLFRGGEKILKPPRKGLIEIAQLWRDKADGKLWISMDDKSGSSASAFDEEQCDDLWKIAQDLGAWLGRKLEQPLARSGGLAARLASEKPYRETVDFDPSVVGLAEGFEQDTFSSSHQQSASMGESTLSIERPSFNPIKTFRRALEAEVKRPVAPQRSIAAQVNEILQEAIEGTELEQRGISLMELPEKGMVVLIGLTQYDSVDDVPDAEIKAALKKAVATWEKRMLG